MKKKKVSSFRRRNNSKKKENEIKKIKEPITIIINRLVYIKMTTKIKK